MLLATRCASCGRDDCALTPMPGPASHLCLSCLDHLADDWGMTDRALQLLDRLTPTRRQHSEAVARRAREAFPLIKPRWHHELHRAALLHDIGYESPAIWGTHALDGATELQALGESAIVCDLVAHHTAATIEADEAGIPASAFAAFTYHGSAPIDQLRSIIAWADLTTSPTGHLVTVDERLGEILQRYPPGTLVHRSTTRAAGWMRLAGTSPLASATQSLAG